MTTKSDITDLYTDVAALGDKTEFNSRFLTIVGVLAYLSMGFTAVYLTMKTARFIKS